MDNLAACCKQSPHDALAELTVAEDEHVAAGAADVAALPVAEDDYVADGAAEVYLVVAEAGQGLAYAGAPAAHDLAARLVASACHHA